MIRDAKRVSKCEKCQRIHERQLRKQRDFDYAGITKSQQGAEVKILIGAGPRGETFARAVHRKGATFEDLEQFLKVLQTRYGNIPVEQDRMFARSCTQYGRTTWDPRQGVTAVDQSQANGRAEQRMRALRGRWQILVEDARRRC